MVPRTALLERLLAAPATRLLCVTAPPGYGKTTLLAQWAERRSGVAWVSLDRRDNDPVVLLSYLAVALDRVEPVDPGLFRTLASPGAASEAKRTTGPSASSPLSDRVAPVWSGSSKSGTKSPSRTSPTLAGPDRLAGRERLRAQATTRE